MVRIFLEILANEICESVKNLFSTKKKSAATIAATTFFGGSTAVVLQIYEKEISAEQKIFDEMQNFFNYFFDEKVKLKKFFDGTEIKSEKENWEKKVKIKKGHFSISILKQNFSKNENENENDYFVEFKNAEKIIFQFKIDSENIFDKSNENAELNFLEQSKILAQSFWEFFSIPILIWKK